MTHTDRGGLRRFDRSAMLTELAERHFDVVVVGAGVTGAGVGLDAAARGLRTAVVDAEDFGSGASSHSTKLVHGGLRHLRRGELRLVSRALAERRRLLANAPHLVTPLPFVMPVSTTVDPWRLRLFDAALWAYDTAEGVNLGRRHRRLDADQTRALLGRLAGEDLAGGLLVDNAVVDDARLALTLARTACLDHVATVVNAARVVDVVHAPSGRLRGVRVRTAEGDLIDVTARAVVNAAGVGAPEVARLDDPTADVPSALRRVVRIAVRARGLDLDAATLLIGGDGAVVAVPWDGVVLFGATRPAGDIDSARPAAREVEAVLGAVGTRVDLAPSDVTSVRVCERIDGSRSGVTVSKSGLVTVTAGTMTTFRHLAAEAVDRVIDQFADDLDRWVVRRCRTADLPLRGAAGHADVVDRPVALRAATVERLVGRYGGEAGAVLAMVDRDPALADPIGEGVGHMAAEVVHAARYEMANTVADVLDRRTRARLVDARAAATGAERTARLLAAELGWSADRVRAEAEAYRADVDADLSAAPA